MQHPTPIIPYPPWDGDTTETQIDHSGGAATTTYTVGADIYAVIFSSTTSNGVHISPDLTDVDSGVRFADGVNDLRFPLQGALATKPGTAFGVHTDGAARINIVEFKNKAK